MFDYAPSGSIYLLTIANLSFSCKISTDQSLLGTIYDVYRMTRILYSLFSHFNIFEVNVYGYRGFLNPPNGFKFLSVIDLNPNEIEILLVEDCICFQGVHFPKLI